MIEDITQRKQSEEEKTRLESQLFQSQKMEAIGTLAGGIAHDFNNILTALVGYAGLLRMKANNKTLHTYADQILSAAQKATDLIQSLLAFSRQQAASLKPISLHSVLKGTEKLLKRLVTEDIIIKTVLATEDITIMADATQIDQILFNLATNARDAMPQGGILTIETNQVTFDDTFKRFHGYGEPGRYALLSVSDTGVGMDETTRKRIFEPFFTTKEVGKGTGLGLSTVYGIVQQHNGYIIAESKPKKGTTFQIYLPVMSKVGMGETPAAPGVKGGNETILIAEDNEAVRDLMRDVLTEYGYSVLEATDGAEAVKQFKKTDTIDLLIFDSVMPVQNGREAYDEIHKIKLDTKVIFTSGHSRDVFLDKGIEDKKINFLQKPIFPDILLQMVREMLDNR
jgi:nitrogen-specific signal transduction histidine kinase